MNGRDSIPALERFYASTLYLLPLLDGIVFGVFLFKQFPPLQLLFLPLLPLLQVYNSFPFAGLIIFFALLFGVVRNENISHFIRFNTMQAILLDILLILCRLVLQLVESAIQIPLVVETFYNTVFLGIITAVVYAVVQSVRGLYAEIPAISDAVNVQVR
jgi:hypothetical protein